MNIKMIHLSRPNLDNSFSNYENQLEPQLFIKTEKSKQLFEENKDIILQTVEKEISNYVFNDDLCNDEEGFFPKRSYLTGEWYIRSIYFEEEYLSVDTALLGTNLGYKDDYLGLEVVFNYNRKKKRFSVYGINSSSI